MFRKSAMIMILFGASALSVAVFAQDSSKTGCCMTGAGMSSSPSMARDKMFLKAAAEGGMAEVKLGQLAADKATSADVKAFGQKMVDDHTKLNNDMKPIADRMGVTAPTILDAKDQALYDKLNGMSGTAFDRAYVAAMVKDHHQDLKDFTAEKNSTKDPELKTAVTEGLDVIKHHATMAEQLEKTNRGMKTTAAGQ